MCCKYGVNAMVAHSCKTFIVPGKEHDLSDRHTKERMFALPISILRKPGGLHAIIGGMMIQTIKPGREELRRKWDLTIGEILFNMPVGAGGENNLTSIVNDVRAEHDQDELVMEENVLDFDSQAHDPGEFRQMSALNYQANVVRSLY
jgi:hypothetical protein